MTENPKNDFWSQNYMNVPQKKWKITQKTEHPLPQKNPYKNKKTSMSYVNITCFPRYNITESF